MGMTYEQLNGEERSELAGLRRLGLSHAEIGRQLGRHRRTVGRELKRHAAPYEGWVSGRGAEERAVARRKRSRRNRQFGRAELALVEKLLRKEWSPEQVSECLRRSGELFRVSSILRAGLW